MPNGTLVSVPLVIDPTDLSPTVQELEFDFSIVARFLDSWWDADSALTYVSDTMYPGNALAGGLWSSFADVFYNRIWVIPASINLSGVPVTFSTGVTLWNSYFTSKSLTSITPTNLTGVVLTGPTSVTLDSLETQNYTLSLTPAIPPSLSGNYLFTFSNAEDPTLLVSGTIAELVVFPHDWNEAVVERLQYLTDVIEAKDGTEQRIRLRKYPRRQYEYKIWTATSEDTKANAVQRALYHNQLAYGIGKSYIVPMWQDATVLSSDLTLGTTTIPFSSTVSYDYSVDGYILIYQDYMNFDVLKITAVGASSVTVGSPGVTRDWAAGMTLAPIRNCFVGQELLSGEVLTHDFEMHNQLWDVSVTDAVTGSRITNTAPSTTYKGYEVWLAKMPDFGDQPSVEIYNPLRTLDYETGVSKLDPRYAFTRERTSMSVQMFSRQDYSEFLGFAERRAGKLNPFWIPNYSRDFQILNSGLSTDKVLEIKYIGYSQYVKQNPARRDLCFQDINGNYYFRRITDSVNNGNGTETITLDTALGIAFTPDTFRFVSYLRWVRLDSDIIEISFEASNYPRTKLLLVDLLDSPS